MGRSFIEPPQEIRSPKTRYQQDEMIPLFQSLLSMGLAIYRELPVAVSIVRCSMYTRFVVSFTSRCEKHSAEGSRAPARLNPAGAFCLWDLRVASDLAQSARSGPCKPGLGRPHTAC